jgi:hypothetical protein
MGEQPEEQGQRDAEEQTGNYGKVKSRVFAVVNDVAGQFSQAEGELVPEIEKCSEKDKEGAEEKKRTAEFTKGVHQEIVEELGQGSNDANRRR